MSAGRMASWVFLTTLGGLAAGCSSDRMAGESAAVGPPEPDRLWQHLQVQNYRESWALWPGKGEKYKGTEPHGALLTTYLNPPAERAVAEKPGEMPAGAVIVKENYKPDGTLAAITTMQKVAGFNPGHGDWYFTKFDPRGRVQKQGKVDSCIACHSKVSANDYIYTGPVR